MSGGNKKIHEHEKHNTNGFDKNPQNIGNGRKKKIYTVLKEKGYSKDDITTAFGELAFYSEKELDDIINKKDVPIITKIVAKTMQRAYKDSDYSRIKEILEHVIGKPLQKVEQENTNNTGLTINVNTKEEADNIKEMLDNID